VASVITSTKNPRVKEAAKLRQRRGREQQGRFLIDGAREILRALAAGIELVDVFVCEPLCQSSDSRTALKQLKGSGAEMLSVTPAVFEKLAFGERAEGLVAVAHTPRKTLGELKLPADALILVLEGVEKPGNVGAVLRTADGAGASALIVADGGTDLYNPNTVRASLGTIFSVQVCAAAGDEVRRWLRERKIKVFAARVDGKTDYTAADLTGATAIVLGSEAEGLSAEWGDATSIRLPMLGAADSLNVSAAAAVLVYEARRQRDAKK
jgi:RNA methyltransferase, TrmH family